MSVFEVSVIALWVLLLVILLLGAGIVRRLAQQQKQLAEFLPLPGLTPGEAAPDFTATTLEGRTVGRANPSGRETVLGFFSAHCSACRDHIPHFNRVGAAADERGMQALAVIDGTEDLVGHLLEALRPPVAAVLAPFGSSTLLRDYRVSSFPSYLGIAPDGTVVAAASTAVELAAALELSVPDDGARPAAANGR